MPAPWGSVSKRGCSRVGQPRRGFRRSCPWSPGRRRRRPSDQSSRGEARSGRIVRPGKAGLRCGRLRIGSCRGYRRMTGILVEDRCGRPGRVARRRVHRWDKCRGCASPCKSSCCTADQRASSRAAGWPFGGIWCSARFRRGPGSSAWRGSPVGVNRHRGSHGLGGDAPICSVRRRSGAQRWLMRRLSCGGRRSL